MSADNHDNCSDNIVNNVVDEIDVDNIDDIDAEEIYTVKKIIIGNWQQK